MFTRRGIFAAIATTSVLAIAGPVSAASAGYTPTKGTNVTAPTALHAHPGHQGHGKPGHHRLGDRWGGGGYGHRNQRG